MKALLKPRWVLTMLLVIAGAGFLIRLGFWQLQRLEERRAFNERVLAQVNETEINLNQFAQAEGLFDMEYRPVLVTGVFDHSQEVLLRNQVWEDRPGYHILTPLKIQGSEWAVLVDRGWIPFDDAGELQAYEEPGTLIIHGRIRRPQTKPDFGGVPDPTLAPGETRLAAWNIVNLTRIQQQIPYRMLPVYIEQAPEMGKSSAPPFRETVLPEISEGSHLGYAFQFFSFAAILALGFPFFLKQQLNRS